MKQSIQIVVTVLFAIVLWMAVITGGCYLYNTWPPWEPDPPVIQPESHRVTEQIPGTFFDND